MTEAIALVTMVLLLIGIAGLASRLDAIILLLRRIDNGQRGEG